MAVVRITATARWHRRAADAVASAAPHASRELKRAAERRGSIAELTSEEAIVLADALPGDEVAERARADAERGERGDAERRARLRGIQERWPRERNR